MRPNAYGGYCALENSLPTTFRHFPLTSNHQQPQQQLQQPPYSRQQYPNVPPPLLHQHCSNGGLRLGSKNSPTGVPLPYIGSNHKATNIQTSQQPPPPSSLHHRSTKPNPPITNFHHAPSFSSTQRAAAPTLSLPARLLPTELAASHNYAKLPPPDAVNQQRIHECAGIPLISTAYSQRQRLQRKILPASNQSLPALGTQQNGIRELRSHNNMQSTFNWAVPPYVQSEHAVSGNIAHLAAHAQGSPLLLQKISQPSTYWGNNVNVCLPPQTSAAASYRCTAPDKSRLLRYQHSAPPALSTPGKENFVQASKEHSTKSTLEPASANVNVDNTRETNETCLPRIIKPRKRRKKDRKPTNGVLLKLEAELEAKAMQASAATAEIHTHPNTQQAMFLMLTQQNEMDAYNQRLEGYASATSNTGHACVHQSTGICFCSNCNPLRSIWEYPLRRSLSDTSTASASEKSSNDGFGSPTLSTSSSSSSSTVSTPESRPTATNALSTLMPPAAEKENFSPITTHSTRANIVGVIGSNRISSNHDSLRINGAKGLKSSYEQPKVRRAAAATATNSLSNGGDFLSDSNDSGYGDILSGINIADDLFKNVTKTEPVVPIALSANPAETLLSASINEISRQLMETCMNETMVLNNQGRRSTFSTCSDVSNDSGLDSAGSLRNCDELVFRFDHLNLREKNSTSIPLENDLETAINSVALSATTIPAFELFLDFNNNATINSKSEHQLLQHESNDEAAQSGLLLGQKDLESQTFPHNSYDFVWRHLPASEAIGSECCINDLMLKSAFSTTIS